MHSCKFLFLKEKQSLNFIQIEQTWCHSTPHELLYSIPPKNFIVSMVTELQCFIIGMRINVLQFLCHKLILLSIYSKKHVVCYRTKNTVVLF